MSTSFPDLLIAFEEAVAALKVKLSANEEASTTYNGEYLTSIAKDIADFKATVTAFLEGSGVTFDEFMAQSDADVAAATAQVVADIDSKWAAIQALVDSTLVFELKTELDAYTPTMDANGQYPIAKVWGDVESNNGIYGYSGAAWVKSEYDPITKMATFDYLKELIVDDYESDLTGGYNLVSDDGFVIARVTSEGVFESLVPFKFVHHADNPYSTPESTQNLIDASVNPEISRLNELETFVNLTYEADLCGHCVISDDGFLISRVKTNGGATEVFTELDLSKSPTEFLTKDEINKLLNVSGYESACWTEVSDDSYLVKAFDYETGQVNTLATTVNNPMPQIDSLNRVIYLNEDGDKVWQWPEGSIEFPFLPNNAIVCYGDSKTAAGSGYGDIIKTNYPQYSPNIQGIGGQRSSPIAQRSGGAEVLITVEGNEIPASGGVTCGYASLIFSPYNFTLRVEIAGVVGLLNQNNYVYTFTRDEDGDAVKTYEKTPVTVLSGLTYNSDVLDEINQNVGVFWLGTNDVGKDDYSEDDVINNIKSCISSLRAYCKRYIILSVPYLVNWVDTDQGGGSTVSVSELKFSHVKSLLSRCNREFGSALVDVTQYHKVNNPTFITSYTVGGEEFDVLNYTYSTDGIHGNTAGRTADADMIINELLSRGFLNE
jgi:lysophospholipase L1-like esterase